MNSSDTLTPLHQFPRAVLLRSRHVTYVTASSSVRQRTEENHFSISTNLPRTIICQTKRSQHTFLIAVFPLIYRKCFLCRKGKNNLMKGCGKRKTQYNCYFHGSLFAIFITRFSHPKTNITFVDQSNSPLLS